MPSIRTVCDCKFATFNAVVVACKLNYLGLLITYINKLSMLTGCDFSADLPTTISRIGQLYVTRWYASTWTRTHEQNKE